MTDYRPARALLGKGNSKLENLRNQRGVRELGSSAKKELGGEKGEIKEVILRTFFREKKASPEARCPRFGGASSNLPWRADYYLAG